jgi:hypothetical protein
LKDPVRRIELERAFQTLNEGRAEFEQLVEKRDDLELLEALAEPAAKLQAIVLERVIAERYQLSVTAGSAAIRLPTALAGRPVNHALLNLSLLCKQGKRR